MSEPIRLAKRLAALVPCSRREAELYIAGGWVTVDGGSFVLSEPDGSAGFYPVNDHPLDKATYTFRVTDSYTNTLTDSGIPFIENGTINGAAQFPPGP